MSKWVPILVRLEDFAEIATLVADRELGRDDSECEVDSAECSTKVMVSSEAAQQIPDMSWSIEDLQALAKGASETAKRWALAMDACCEVASSDNPWLSTSEVAARSGMSINEWRDAPRKITRHLKANFPNVPTDSDGQQAWPLRGEGKPGSQEIHWSMSVEQAKRWRQVRGASLHE